MKRIVAAVGIVLLLGCGSSDEPSETTSVATASLVPQQDADVFMEFMTATPASTAFCPVDPRVASMLTLDALALSSVAETSFSMTNLQETDVDEADRVKFDGEHLFVADANVRPGWIRGGIGLVLLPVQPGITLVRTDLGVVGPATENIEPTEPDSPTLPDFAEIRVLSLDPESPEAEEVGVIVSTVENGGIDGMYLLTANDQHSHSLLGVLSQTHVGFDYSSWNSPIHTTLEIIDVTDPSEPVHENVLEIDGSLVASRRLGDRVYLVTRYQPHSVSIGDCPSLIAVEAEPDPLPSVQQILPMLRVNGGDPVPLLDIADCFVPESLLDGGGSPVITTISSIDLHDPADRVSVCVAGLESSVYASPAAIYLTQSTRFQPLGPNRSQLVNREQILKFSLEETGPTFRGEGSVQGRLAGSIASFAMGENDGVLGVVTSTWSSEHHLSLLREKQTVEDGEPLRLEEIAHLPSEAEPAPIGKPGESLHSVRFVGDRVYVVTFKKIDPLYIIDISQPESPRITGEVEVPGYSDYLHPIGDDLLLGVGKDAYDMGDFAWYQGVKLELFDVSDPSRLHSVASRVVGMRGSQSAALGDHHALAQLSLGDGLHRVAIPVEVHEGEPASPSTFHPWSHSGLYLFEIEENDDPSRATLSSVGAVVRAEFQDYDDTDYWSSPPEATTLGDRAVLHEDIVHYVHGKELWSADWFAPEEVTGPQ